MKGLTDDHIAIDTNVFRHLRSPEWNVDDHITGLLTAGMRDQVRLLMDSAGIILDEYQRLLVGEDGKPSFEVRDSEDPVHIALILYWMTQAEQVMVDVAEDPVSRLVDVALPLLPEGSKRYWNVVVDRVFVYVAFEKDRVLVTNDDTDILSKRDVLRARARGVGQNKADVLTSAEAWARVQAFKAEE